MPISFSRYINIISGVGGAAQVKERDLILRVFTPNTDLPVGTTVEYLLPSELPAIETVFGIGSEEYKRALSYSSFVSKQITSPDKISFASYNAAATVSTAYGDPAATGTIAQIIAAETDTFEIMFGATVANLSALNFSADVTYDQVAATLQTAIRAVGGLATATVIFNDVEGNFVIGSFTPGIASPLISFPNQAGVLEGLFGMLSPNTVIVPGEVAETPLQSVQNSVALNTNLATFLFTESSGLTLQQIEAITAWNVTQNNQYMFLVLTTAANAAAWAAGLLGYAGVGLTLYVATNYDYPEMLPAKVAASTDYTQRNVSQNYEFQEDTTLVPTVTDDTDANTYDNLRVNYYGQTQVNGNEINFYQTGVLMGGANAPTDMNTYVNEIWLKGEISVAFMNALLALSEIPANAAGRAIALGIIQTVVDNGPGTATYNGVISVAETLDQTQIEYIVNLASLAVAKQVQTIGYWFDVTFTSAVQTNGTTKWTLNYQLIYAKNNAIRAVNGSDILI
jgi:hypothetical protein